jgi:hypothetical protein
MLNHLDEDFILTINLKDATEKQTHIANDFDITISGGHYKLILNYTIFNFFKSFFFKFKYFKVI